VDEVDSRAEKFKTFQLLENSKIYERLDKVEASIGQIRNVMSKITEQLKGLIPNLDVTETTGASKDEVD